MSNAYWDYTYAGQVYAFLMATIQNDYGVSGLLGNIYAESYICPFICETDSPPCTESYNVTMNQLRSMSSYDFQHYHLPSAEPSKVGYSLAQWTTYSRKDNYYNFCGQSLLGDGQKSMEFLLAELQTPSYMHIYNVLVNATSINQASDYVLQWYEAPQSWQTEIYTRRQYSQNVYDDFSGGPPPANPLPKWLIGYASQQWRRRL